MFLTNPAMGAANPTVVAILGYAVCLLGLFLLALVVKAVVKAAAKAAQKKETAPAEKEAAPAVSEGEAAGSAGEVKLHDVSPRDAAMIMAIVAEKTGRPLNELRFKSIREVK